jgi:hypothetical protein
MTTETILGPALDDPVLERLEAEFLHNPSGSWWPAGATVPSIVELPPPVVEWPLDDDPRCGMTKIRTHSGCCR